MATINSVSATIKTQKSPKKRSRKERSAVDITNDGDQEDDNPPLTPRKKSGKASGSFTPINAQRIKLPTESPSSPSKTGGYTASDDMLILTLRGSSLPWEEGM